MNHFEAEEKAHVVSEVLRTLSEGESAKVELEWVTSYGPYYRLHAPGWVSAHQGSALFEQSLVGALLRHGED